MELYKRVYLVGEDEIPIIARITKSCKRRYHDEFKGPYIYFHKGRDIITGTPLILDCSEEKFEDELNKYGLARRTRIGAKATNSYTREEVQNLVNTMNEEYIELYAKAVQKAKDKHAALLSNHLIKKLERKKSNLEREASFIKKRGMVKKLVKKQMNNR